MCRKERRLGVAASVVDLDRLALAKCCECYELT